ncbi:MAG: hypothetical protein IKO49_04930 [Bacilli bacterium]|nr:hypothetical protein [Bacilli bacterium]
MKENYFIEINGKIYISIWNEIIDNIRYHLLINQNNNSDIVVGSITDNKLIVEYDKDKLKKIIFKMIRNIRLFME